jgi:hypothetical protein
MIQPLVPELQHYSVLAPWWPSQESDWTGIFSASHSYLLWYICTKFQLNSSSGYKTCRANRRRRMMTPDTAWSQWLPAGEPIMSRVQGCLRKLASCLLQTEFSAEIEILPFRWVIMRLPCRNRQILTEWQIGASFWQYRVCSDVINEHEWVCRDMHNGPHY